MIGIEPFVVGCLVSWVAKKARRAGERVEGRLDEAMDTQVDRLCDLVLDKLGAEPAVRQLEQEAAQDVVNERTKLRLQLAVEEAVAQDTGFAAALRLLIEEIRSGAPESEDGLVINARAEGNARMSVQGRGEQHNHFGGTGGA